MLAAVQVHRSVCDAAAAALHSNSPVRKSYLMLFAGGKVLTIQKEMAP